MKQKAVYWAPSGPSGTGQQGWTAPVEISCRWTDTTQEYIDKNGNTKMSKAIVLVDRDLSLDGALRLGTLADVTDPVNPFKNTNTYRISGWAKIPNLKATEFVRKAYL